MEVIVYGRCHIYWLEISGLDFGGGNKVRENSENKQKNVLLITVDQWPGSLLGSQGRDDFFFAYT
ncbi:hypothetical protein HMSSN036_82780 [Paenibacillus macerans]|nr:hypothetical protein HMSSN036_82780 [Paenibacillus macerans]